MSQGRHGIKILGLSLLAALGLMAIASSAQASNFLILETEGGVTKEVGTASGSTAVAGKLLLENGLTIVCNAAEANATLEAAGMAKATVNFSTCSVEGNKFCKVYPTKADMTAKTNAGKLVGTGLGTLILHETSHFLDVEGLGVNKTFSTIFTNTAAEGCTLPLENEVTGLDVLALPNALTHSVNQVIRGLTPAEETLLATLGIKRALKYGNEGAKLDPAEVTNVHLTGASDVGKKFGGQ